MGPRDPHSTSLTLAEEAVAIAFRQKTLLPLDDCLHALQRFIPRLSRSSLHRLYQRHGISNLPRSAEPVREKKALKRYPLGYLRIDITEVRTAEGRAYLFVAIDRTSKFVYAELHKQMMRKDAVDFLEATLKTLPYKVHTVLTDNGIWKLTILCQGLAQSLRYTSLSAWLLTGALTTNGRNPADDEPVFLMEAMDIAFACLNCRRSRTTLTASAVLYN